MTETFGYQKINWPQIQYFSDTNLQAFKICLFIYLYSHYWVETFEFHELTM